MAERDPEPLCSPSERPGAAFGLDARFGPTSSPAAGNANLGESIEAPATRSVFGEQCGC